ncbi:sigma-70 family RNA polymerase sigma factor [Mycobacterium sp. 050272]|uniref:RNA polymerase sigma factor n=1 Tax=Mycobacteriaceae TaxID=1762 RepID=UPI00319498E7
MRERTRTVVDDRWASEDEFIGALQGGDGEAFRLLVATMHAPLVRMARIYLPASIAEDAVQDTWTSVVRTIGVFEGRSTVKTWVFRIMLNRVRALARTQGRTVPFATAGPEADSHPSVDPSRMVHPELGAHHWSDVPARWDLLPEQRLLSGEVRTVISEAMAKLPDGQREVVSMRDVEGWTSEEICDALGISAVNQRVLLHRGRAALRTALEEYLDD